VTPLRSPSFVLACFQRHGGSLDQRQQNHTFGETRLDACSQFISVHVTSAVTRKVEPVAFNFGPRLAPFRAKKPLQVPGDAVLQWERKFQHSSTLQQKGLAGRECRHSAVAVRLSSKQPTIRSPTVDSILVASMLSCCHSAVMHLIAFTCPHPLSLTAVGIPPTPIMHSLASMDHRKTQ
jgi:hypothetical protein